MIFILLFEGKKKITQSDIFLKKNFSSHFSGAISSNIKFKWLKVKLGTYFMNKAKYRLIKTF